MFSFPHHEFIVIRGVVRFKMKTKMSFPFLLTPHTILTGISKHMTVTSADIEMEGNILTFLLIANNLKIIIPCLDITQMSFSDFALNFMNIKNLKTLNSLILRLKRTFYLGYLNKFDDVIHSIAFLIFLISVSEIT